MSQTETEAAETEEIPEQINWDGRTYPYVPPAELDIDPRLKLHGTVDETVDPITHEVLRHALWNINVEHGQSIVRVSGSPSCAYGHDFNPAILDEHGGFVFFGKYNLFLAVPSGFTVKWILENRAEDPGIQEGDIYFSNDPWVGAVHQPDMILAAPVFIDGELFCWVANTLHTWDLGGTAPGGFNPMAEDLYWEAPCVPPVKLVEAGKVRPDIQQALVNNSRLPHLVNLDIRSQITGCEVARDRIVKLVKRYGASTVKASMRKIQDDSEDAFTSRLETIPDGTWTEEQWLEVKLPGDRGVYRNRLSLTKKGDQLIFSNAGSDPQAGTVNTTFGSWAGGIFAMLASLTLFDQMLAIEGALRHCVFDATPGTVSCATRPAAISGGPPTAVIGTVGLSGVVISKMLSGSTDPATREEVMSTMGVLGFPINTVTGIDQRGEPYASFLNDPVGAALPAMSWRDGQDTGGYPWDLESTIPNVEDNELFYPVLYLWRREIAGSGGAGKFRGGNGCEAGLITHKTDQVNWVTVASQVAVPGPGLFGGYPSSTNKYQLIKDAGWDDYVKRTGSTPLQVEDFGGEAEWVGPKTFDKVTKGSDVWVFSWSGAAGYGDPIERDPAMVLDDVTDGRVEQEWAEQVYGVVLGGEGYDRVVDEDATVARRQAIVDERLAEGKPWEGELDEGEGGNPPDGRVSEYVSVVDGELVADGVSLGPASGNYKLGALIRDLPLSEANPEVRDAALYVDNAIGFRQIICPETGRLLQTEVVVDGAPPRWDMRPGAA